MNLPPPTEEENTPCRDLTGQVRKEKPACFAVGGFSDIFEGIWTESPKVTHEVAIKLLRGVHLKKDILEGVRRRLNRESRLWQQLNHPNILEFLGLAQGLGASPALISPLCRNGSVLDYISKNQNAQRLPIVLGIAHGIEYLHSKDVIHGDLKAQNVLISDSGTALLCDFGRSNILDKRGYTTEFSGAYRYMAPELIQFPEPSDNYDAEDSELGPVLTKSTDVYAFSILGVEVISGLMAFHKIRNEYKVVNTVLSGGRPARTDFDSLTPETDALWPILESGWVTESVKRPPITDLVSSISELN